MPFEIAEDLRKLTNATNTRIRLNHPEAPGTKDEKRAAEYDVFLASRSLHCRFHDEALWSGTSKETKTAVLNGLKKAAAYISVYPECIRNVRRYLKGYKNLRAR